VLCEYQCNPFSKNRSGERWKRSPDLLPLGWRYRYFFFAAFFAAFFAGAFLAGAFLVAICLFSLVTNFPSLQILLQLKHI
jgi:hypothetical protein